LSLFKGFLNHFGYWIDEGVTIEQIKEKEEDLLLFVWFTKENKKKEE